MDPEALTDEQRDGLACVQCGSTTAPMRPVDRVDGVQVFACTAHETADTDHALRRQDDRRFAVLMDEAPAPLSGVSGPFDCPPCGLCQNCRYVPS